VTPPELERFVASHPPGRGLDVGCGTGRLTSFAASRAVFVYAFDPNGEKVSQARAALEGRDFVTPDDVKLMAPHVLAHRIIINPASRMKDFASEMVVAEALNRVPVPGVRAAR